MISCNVCLDLIPLVQDGVASEDSIKLVNEHIIHCKSCKAVLENNAPIIQDDKKILINAKKYINILLLLFLIIGIIFGISLSESSDMFLNITIMPILGIIGYYLFRYKAFYILPIILLIINSLISLFKLFLGINEQIISSFIYWTITYSIFSIIGTIIACLLHYAFRKD